MSTADPGEVIRDVLHGGLAVQSTGHGVIKERRENKPESDLICRQIALLTKRLTREAVPEVVNESIANRPGMTSDNAPRMFPQIRPGRIRKLGNASGKVIDYVGAEKHELLFIQVVVKSTRMRIELHRRGRVETESCRV